MKRVDPSLKGPKSVAEATLEVLSAMGGRFMTTLSGGRQEPDTLRTSTCPMHRHRAARISLTVGLLTPVPTPLV
jgi:hypothetical protein